MKYISLFLLGLVIFAGTWTGMSQDFFGPTKELNALTKENVTSFESRSPLRIKSDLNPNLIKARDYVEKGELKEAIMEYEAGLSNKEWAQKNPKKWAENVQTLLSITDPILGYELLSSFLGQESIPANLRSVVSLWRVHAREWANSQAFADANQSLVEAKNLLQRAADLEQKYRRPVGLVLYLRTVALLDSVFRMQNQEKNQEALLLAGRAAEGIKDRENYREFYQRCVDIDPHSEFGQACLVRAQAHRPLTAKHLAEEAAD